MWLYFCEDAKLHISLDVRVDIGGSVGALKKILGRENYMRGELSST